MNKTLLIIIAVIVIVGGAFMFFYPVSEQKSPTTSPPQFLSLPDGKFLGYIHNVRVPDLVISFDDAIWLTGKEAQDAAIEAGHCTEANRFECTPNDFFIKNERIADEAVAVGDSAMVVMQTWKMEETEEVTSLEILFGDFAGLINDPALHWRTLPYHITIQNGKVTLIEEQYIP